MVHRSRLAGMALALLCTLPAAAQQGRPPPEPTPGPHPGDQVAFCGKVVPLVEAGCIGIVGPGMTIEITSITPKPAVGTTIQGTGIIGGQMTKCMQGIHLQSATYAASQYCTSGP